MFNYKLRDKLPLLQDRVEVPKVRNRNLYNKGLSTVQASTNTVPRKVNEVGDEVLVQ